MIRILVLLLIALLFASCGKSSAPSVPYIPPPYIPPAQPPPISFSGGPISGPWIVTQGSSPGAPMGALLQCASASVCWISYAEMTFPATLNGAQTFTLNYRISGDAPTFAHDSPDNTPDGASIIRLLIWGSGYRLFSVDTQPLRLGANSLAVVLAPANWIMVDPSGNTVTDPAIFANVISHVTSVGYCFGGGYFACHGVAIPSGNAVISISGASIQ